MSGASKDVKSKIASAGIRPLTSTPSTSPSAAISAVIPTNRLRIFASTGPLETGITLENEKSFKIVRGVVIVSITGAVGTTLYGIERVATTVPASVILITKVLSVRSASTSSFFIAMIPVA